MTDAQESMQGMAELPQYAIGVDDAGNIWLNVGFQLGQHSFFLCNYSNYEEVARKLHKNIMDAGVAAKRQKSGLIVAEGSLPNATLSNGKGRKQLRSRTAGTARSRP